MNYVTNVKLAVYRHFADTGQRPTPSDVARSVGADQGSVVEAYRDLFSQRLLVLEPDGSSIRMAQKLNATRHQDLRSLSNLLADLVYFRGRVALYALLKALDVGPGDEVATQAFTCVAVPEAIMATGASPIYVDLEPTGFNMDVGDLQHKITSRTRAIIVQHTPKHNRQILSSRGPLARPIDPGQHQENSVLSMHH